MRLRPLLMRRVVAHRDVQVQKIETGLQKLLAAVADVASFDADRLLGLLRNVSGLDLEIRHAFTGDRTLLDCLAAQFPAYTDLKQHILIRAAALFEEDASQRGDVADLPQFFSVWLSDYHREIYRPSVGRREGST